MLNAECSLPFATTLFIMHFASAALFTINLHLEAHWHWTRHCDCANCAMPLPLPLPLKQIEIAISEQNFGYRNSFFPAAGIPEQKEEKTQTKPTRRHVPVLFLAGCVCARHLRTWS
jgi:hypothetical protein